MPRVIAKALLQGTEAPLFAMRMVDRKLRWQLLRRPPPFQFDIVDKLGQKDFAQRHGAEVAKTLAVIDRAEIAAAPTVLGTRLAALPSCSTSNGYVLKPVHGYQNKHTYAVRSDEEELLRGDRFDVDTVASAIAEDGAFPTYMVEELLQNEEGLSADSNLPLDFKFWCFGATIAHCTVMCGRWRTSDSAYTVAVADCDAAYTPRPTWCALPTDAESGLVELVDLPPKPRCWEEMVATARRLGEAVGAFSRIDFYATPNGPVFGEFQLLFDLVDWNANADDAIRRLWRGRDGAAD